MSFIIGLSDKEKNEISQIEDDAGIQEEERGNRLKKSMISIKQTTPKKSSKTIFSIANTMMGSALLVMPINFYNTGMLSGIITALLMAYISYKTCNLVILHSLPDEIDYPEAINRILGKKWEVFYNILSMILLFLVGIIDFILMAHGLYAILKNVCDSSGWAPEDKVSWDVFSLQYVGIIIFVLCFIISFFEDLRIVLKINDKGVYMIIIFCIYAIYLGIYGLVNYDFTYVVYGTPGKNNKGLEIVLFTYNIETLIGIFGLAYCVHNVANGIMKSNPQEFEQNTKDLKIAYSIVFILYVVLGVFGMFAVGYLYHTMYTDKIPETMMDLIVKSNPGMTQIQNIVGIASLILIFCQLTTVIPILLFFTRRQFYNLFYSTGHKINRWQFHAFNLAFNVSCLIIQLCSLDPSMIISITGAVGGFFLIYVFPIFLHLKCLYFSKNVVTSSINIQNTEDNSNSYLSDKLVSNSQVNDKKEDQVCVDHSKALKQNKILVITFYIIIGMIGAGIMIIQFVKLFRKKETTA